MPETSRQPGPASRLLLSYYGDDLTGSTDVMEALSAGGVPTVLFIDKPSAEQLARFPDVRAIGLAGTSRSESPAWMDEHLTPALAWLRDLRAGICHYKTCSTFDSSPTVGSVGKALDIGAKLFGRPTVPLVVGAPQLKRYTMFGQLFAAYQGNVYRIDRHPVMSRHPVTPMNEADLREHLALQTGRSIGLVDLPTINGPDASAACEYARKAEQDILLFDVADEMSQNRVGAMLESLSEAEPVFTVGSSGVEYALLTAWRRAGLIGLAPEFPVPGPVERIAVVSGSCSPTTERQIRHATSNGFEGIEVDPLALAGEAGEQHQEAAVRAGLQALDSGRSVILYTALGPASDRFGASGGDEGARHAIGRRLGRILRALIEQQGLTRAVIAGGDTSSHALRELDIFALTTRLPLPQTPGSPLCTAYGTSPAFDGLEIALKGGQIGKDDYLNMILAGQP